MIILESEHIENVKIYLDHFIYMMKLCIFRISAQIIHRSSIYLDKRKQSMNEDNIQHRI